MPATKRQLERTNMQNITDIYVDGKFVRSGSTATIEVVNPTTEGVIATVPDGPASDAESAIAAARRAFPAWAALEPSERARYLTRIYEGLAARREEIAASVASEVGMPYAIALEWQADLPINNFRFYAERAADYSFVEDSVRHSMVVREPIGVVGAITPWNYPLHQIALKVAPALAAGCTVVLKPSEVAPLTAYILAEVAHAAGLPAGVFNLVSGRGQVVGEVLAASPDVDMISFTGSTVAGKRVSELAATTVKRVALELGGKSANLILDGADLEAAITDGVNNCFFNSGQTCTALTRMLVPRVHLKAVEEIAVRAANATKVGDPFDAKVGVGPVVSAAQFERVLKYIGIGIDEGAELLTGGTEPIADRGYFVAPTILSAVTGEMRVAREEIFGPVLVILPYDTEEDGIALANDSDYGLSGGVWAKHLDKAISVARKLRTGQVSVNGGGFNIEAPFGGYKQSGNGREAGVHGLEEYLEVKSIHGAVAV
jgi:aldehyde dehydrogenase (NAD+)